MIETMSESDMDSLALAVIGIILLVAGYIIALIFPEFGAIIKWLSVYCLFLMVNSLANVKFDNFYRVFIALILGITVIVSVYFLSSAFLGSAIWGGVGANLDDLVDAIIRLLEWLKANDFIGKASGGGIVI